MSVRFDGRVAIVTGAGAGLGRTYALLLASRGAKVVVNDLGVGRNGEGKGTKAADVVVQEIISKGGQAVPDYNSVLDGDKIVETALANYGRVDIVLNNAGILRDKSFSSISETDWNLIHDVHLKGSFKTSQAAWPHFKKQKYGRVIMTSSNSGLYGNFGQANYSAAKMGLIGLCNTMAIEGRKYNINCNVIVPTAASRLTKDILPPDLFDELKPELIAPVVVWLCHENCSDNGSIIESAAGWATKYAIMRGCGTPLREKLTDNVTPEDVRNRWDSVTNLKNTEHLTSIEEASLSLVNQLDAMRESDDRGGNPMKEAAGDFEVNEKACILYALGIGASVKNESDLQFLYEGHEQFSAFPTYGILPGLMAVMMSPSTTEAIPGKTIDLSQILHGEQYLEIIKPMPKSGNLKSKCQVVDILDKGKNAVIITDVVTTSDDGEEICKSQITTFVVGGGGFGGKRTSDKSVASADPPNRKPDLVVTEKTSIDQAALYRLSGDSNPMHIDPSFAAIAGYSRPILHGLCSLGFSARHVLANYASNDPSLFKSIKARFTKPVYPGETLKIEMWQDGNRIYFKTSTVESNNVVISGAFIDLHRTKAANSMPPDSTSSGAKSDVVFEAIKERLAADKSAAKKVNGVFLYNILNGGKTVATWTLDLKDGEVYRGSPGDGKKIDTTLTLDDQDMIDMATGKLNPQVAFMKGKLKIKGNIALVQRLKPLLTQAKL